MNKQYQNSLLKDLALGAYEGLRSALSKRRSTNVQLYSSINPPASSYFGISDKRVNVDQNMSLNTDWFWACANHRANTQAKLGWTLYSKTTRKEDREIKYHPIYDVWEAAEDYAEFGLMYLLSYGYDCIGRSVFYVKMNSLNRPQEIIPIFPEMGTLTISKDDYGRVTSYHLVNGLRQIDFDPYNIFHYRCINLSDATYGIGLMSAILRKLQLARFQDEHGIKLFEQGILPGGEIHVDRVLAYPEPFLSEAAKYRDTYQSVLNANKMMFTDKEAKFFPLGTSPKELDFVNSRIASKDEIIGISGVPRVIFGLDATTKADSETTERVYMEHTIGPLVINRDSMMSKDFANKYYGKKNNPELRGSLCVKTDLPDFEDQKMQAEISEKNSGALMAILINVKSGKLPKDSAEALIKNTFDYTEQQIADMLEPIEVLTEQVTAQAPAQVTEPKMPQDTAA